MHELTPLNLATLRPMDEPAAPGLFMETPTLYVRVLRDPEHDCTNGGVTSKFASFVLCRTEADAAAKLEEIESGKSQLDPEQVLLLDTQYAGPYNPPRAFPYLLRRSGTWSMFGGNFVTSCDSRLKGGPVKVLDRVER